MRIEIRAGLLLALVVLIAGCEQESRSKPTADLGAVEDGAPYLCDMVPEHAFRRVTGISVGLNSKWDGPQKDNGLCLVRAAEHEWPLGLDWSYEDGESALRLQRETWKDRSPHYLPPELGEGLAVTRPTAGAETRPNFVIALFRCGKKKPWISIDFVPVVRGRDAVRDMFDFMRIAEKRFGELHKCTPRPA